MSQYIYNKLYQDINIGIYSVNELYVREKEFPFNPELYDETVSQQLLEMVVTKNFQNLNVMLERKPNPNTTDVLGKSLLDYLFQNEKYEEGMRLIKMGAKPSQEILKKCLTKNLKNENLKIIHVLVEYGLKPLTKEELLTLLNTHYDFLNKLKVLGKELSDETKCKILLSFEKKLKFMYRKYII